VVTWSTNTINGQSVQFAMQTDGNLVLYPSIVSGPTALWNAGTPGNPGAFLQVQDDGNLVIYSSTAIPLWATATGC
jgi:hypothetical protein